VIGIIDYDFGGIYSVDLNSAYKCILKPMDRRGGGGRDKNRQRSEPEKFKVGDIISAKVDYVDEVKEAKLSGPRKIVGGYVFQVKPLRVPRIIGRQKSMITLIREKTGSTVSVGQNGLVWVKGGDIDLASNAVRMVEREAPTSGLTDRVTEYLISNSSNK
jgi:exosome complex component RRP4